LNKKAAAAYGTSAATPTVAILIAKLNEELLSAGKPPLGFVNPLFYKNPNAFNDVTKGNNNGRNGGTGGFDAAPGWDPTTGLGTPDFEKLKTVVMNAAK
jgi:tripeptidyl-peptidase-1